MQRPRLALSYHRRDREVSGYPRFPPSPGFHERRSPAGNSAPTGQRRGVARDWAAMEYLDIAGENLPVIGFGTSGLRGATCARMVELALELGYRHIDTASVYGNEAEIGRAIRSSSVDRGKVFLATKIWTRDLGRHDIRPAAERSLGALGTDHVDLFLAHWPTEDIPLGEVLDGLAGLREAGLARHVGVCNFTAGTCATPSSATARRCSAIRWNTTPGSPARSAACAPTWRRAAWRWWPTARWRAAGSAPMRCSRESGHATASRRPRWRSDGWFSRTVSRRSRERHAPSTAGTASTYSISGSMTPTSTPFRRSMTACASSIPAGRPNGTDSDPGGLTGGVSGSPDRSETARTR